MLRQCDWLYDLCCLEHGPLRHECAVECSLAAAIIVHILMLKRPRLLDWKTRAKVCNEPLTDPFSTLTPGCLTDLRVREITLLGWPTWSSFAIPASHAVLMAPNTEQSHYLTSALHRHVYNPVNSESNEVSQLHQTNEEEHESWMYCNCGCIVVK